MGIGVIQKTTQFNSKKETCPILKLKSYDLRQGLFIKKSYKRRVREDFCDTSACYSLANLFS